LVSLLSDGILVPVLMAVVMIAVGTSVFLTVRLRRRADSSRKLLSVLRERIADGRQGYGPEYVADEPRDVLEAVERAMKVLHERAAGSQRESEAVLSILSRINEGIIVTDTAGIIRLANRAQLDRLGLADDHVLGRSLIEVTRDHEVYELVRKCLSSGLDQRSLIETQHGRRFVYVTATPYGDGEGCAIVFQDRTELRRLEKVRRDFVANISHELRTPLSTLKLLSETLTSGGIDDADLRANYSARIEVEVDRLAQMIMELGELSLIESGQVRLDLAPVSISMLVSQAVDRLQAQASRSGLTLDVVVPEDLPVPQGDARRLEQVLVNLLHNAIKFTQPGGCVRVHAEEADGAVLLSVEDDGVGIPEVDLDRIFERFYKADRSRSSSGTGMGLSIARHIVELHGGRIWAESTEGRGSRFILTLPFGAG